MHWQFPNFIFSIFSLSKKVLFKFRDIWILGEKVWQNCYCTTINLMLYILYSTTVLRNMYVLYMFVALPILKHKITFEKFDMCFKGTIHIMKQS